MIPEVSIIVPVYNVEKYIGKCIQSIISQSLSNIEIVLVDDGSSDMSGKICDMYASKDSRIKVIHKINEGVSVARNIGLKTAAGEYIGFVDGDDYIDEKMYETLLTSIKSQNADISICNVGFIKDGNLIKDQKEDSISRIISKEETLIKLLDASGFVTACYVNKLYNKKLIADIEFPIGKKIAEDLQFTYYSIQKARKITYVSFTGYYYVQQRNGSSTSSIFGMHEYDRYNIIKSIVNDINSHFPLIMKSAYGYKTVNGTLSIVNAMLRSQHFDQNFLFKLQKETRNELTKVISASCSFQKKVQVIIFLINFELYKRIYKKLKKNF
jgi:glycosyltransferase involved in cell wall biosynthesis